MNKDTFAIFTRPMSTRDHQLRCLALLLLQLELLRCRDLLAERGIVVSYESIRRRCFKFGSRYLSKPKRRERQLGDIWHVDEVFINITGQLHYL